MTQEIAVTGTPPEDGIWRAWLDAFLHPRFETFQRWYPRMGRRWRAISLVVSLALILVTCLMRIAIAAYSAGNTASTLEWRSLTAYLVSPPGIFRAIFYTIGSVLVLFAMPAVVTLISPRSLGPYRIRFKRVLRPWMQIQPAICLLLLLSAIAQLVFSFFQSTSLIFELVAVMLTAGPALQSWGLTCEALAAGSSRDVYLVGLVAAVPGILVWLLPPMLGHPGV